MNTENTNPESAESTEVVEHTPESITVLVEASGDEAQARWLRSKAGQAFLAEQDGRNLIVEVENAIVDAARAKAEAVAAAVAAAEEKARAEADAAAKAAAEANGIAETNDDDADGDVEADQSA